MWLQDIIMNKEFDDLNKALRKYTMISCPQFPKMLFYNNETKQYEHDGKVVESTDQRLIDYLEFSKYSKPI